MDPVLFQGAHENDLIPLAAQRRLYGIQQFHVGGMVNLSRTLGRRRFGAALD